MRKWSIAKHPKGVIKDLESLRVQGDEEKNAIQHLLNVLEGNNKLEEDVDFSQSTRVEATYFIGDQYYDDKGRKIINNWERVTDLSADFFNVDLPEEYCYEGDKAND